jgi:glycosyltransferase involved in cell wall biosynthesis
MSEHRPRVSVIVPTYDRKELVVEAVDSVLAQTMEDFEVVVVDDGSTDGTPEVLAKRYAGEPRVRVVRRANGGPAAARNTGLDAARADAIAFLDSDNVYLPDHLEHALRWLDALPDVDLVMTDMLFEHRGVPEGTTLFGHVHFRAPLSLDAMATGAWGVQSPVVVRAAAARAIRFDETLPRQEDTEFFFRFHASGRRLALVPHVTVRYRRRTPLATKRLSEDDVEMARASLILLDRHRDAARDRVDWERRVSHERRKLGRALVRAGRLREARPYVLEAWRRRPMRVKPLWWWVRGFLPGAGGDSPPPARPAATGAAVVDDPRRP